MEAPENYYTFKMYFCLVERHTLMINEAFPTACDLNLSLISLMIDESHTLEQISEVSS